MTDLEQEFMELWGSAETAKTEFAPVPAGKYHAEITSVKHIEGDEEKAPCVNWEVTITDSGKNVENRKVWQRNQITGRGIGFLKKNLETLGLAEGITGRTSMLAKLEQALGLKVEVKVTQREYNGKIYNDFFFNELLDTSDVHF